MCIGLEHASILRHVTEVYRHAAIYTYTCVKNPHKDISKTRLSGSHQPWCVRPRPLQTVEKEKN